MLYPGISGIFFFCAFLRPSPHHPECRNPYWTCYSPASQAGHPQPGGVCFRLPCKISSSSNLQLWPTLVPCFCRAADFPPMPLVDHSLCIFGAYLAKEGLTQGTIKSYLSALHHYHILDSQGDPFAGDPFPLLQYVLRGIKHSPGRAPRQPRLPITPPILRVLKEQWAPAAATASLCYGQLAA